MRLADKAGNEFDFKPMVCPTCGPAPQRRLGLRGGRHQRWGLGVETTVVRCVDCGLIFPNPFPYPVAPQELYGDAEKYFAAHDLDRRIALYRRLSREAIERSGKTELRVLDIGAGRGDFLKAATLEGISDVTGLEFADAMIEFAKQHFGLTLAKLSVEAFAATNPKPFDVVVLNAVLEHVYDPNTFIEAVARLTRPGSLVYIDVPQEPNLLTTLGNGFNRALGRPQVLNLQPTWAPFHVFGFNPRSLARLLEKHGFGITSVRVRSAPRIRSTKRMMDRVQSLVAEQLLRVGNLTGTASNMYVWARRR